jgi:hypothetical protein
VFSDVTEVLSTALHWHVHCCKPCAMPTGNGVRWRVMPLLLLSPSLSPAKNVLPPPARDAGSSGAELRITHTHRVVRACRLEAQAAELRCGAKLEPAEAETKLTLGPIPPASLDRRADVRRVIEVLLPSGRPTSTTSIGLAPGLWEVVWPDYHRRPRFNAKPGDKIELALDTTTGRCDAAPGQCTLIPDSSTTRVRISER